MVYKQHLVEWFSGKQLPSYWTKVDIAGTNTFAMVDSVDGGFQITSGSGAYNRASIWFNGKNQYAHDGSTVIAVSKFDNSANRTFVGLSDIADIAGVNDNFATFSMLTTNTYFSLRTGDDTTQTLTETDITLDTSYHCSKVECGSSDIKLTLDGQLKATKTTNRPIAKMCPTFHMGTLNSSTAISSIRYMEAYNT